jgi:hypothetical protein
MASTYTSRLRLVKQGDGDNPNTWGVVLNDGMISLVDDAIAAYTTVEIGAAATVTLSAVDGASDVPRSAFLEFKGSVGGSHNTITMIIPAQSKSYVVNNKVSANTTATDVVKIKTAGGSGYDVPFGSVGVCATNIADVSLADLRYVRTSVTTTATIRGDITYEAGTFKVGTSARAYNPITTLTDAASIAVNFALGNNFLVTIGGNRTLAAPTNAVAGQTGNIYVIQDGTGSRTLAYNTAYQFVSAAVPILSTGAGDVDMLIYSARSATTIDSVVLKNFDR